MKFRVIKTIDDYNEATKILEELGDKEDFQNNEELIEQFELLSTLISLYEKQNFPIPKGHPIEIIQLKMDYLGLKRKDLIPLIGSSGVVSEVFSKKRSLSKKMIRAFSELLDIDQSLLNAKYELVTTQSKDEVCSVKAESSKPKFDFIRSKYSNVLRFRNQTRECKMLFNINTY